MVDVNYLAVLIAAIVSMALGFLWYSKLMFGKPWMKLMGYTSESLKKAQKEMGKLYGLSFVLAFITAYVLSHVMFLSRNFFGYGEVQTGLTTAFWMWIGFVMPVQLTAEIFGGKNWNMFAINTGYQLVALLAIGYTIAVL